MAEYDENLGNSIAKPRSETSANPIYNNLSNHLNFAEKSYADSSYWSDSQEKPYNPDDLVRKRYDYSIYEEMGKDDQVSVCLQLKRDLILASGFDIIVEGTDDSLLKIRDDLEKSLKEDCEVPLMNSLEELLSAFDFGFSVSEKIFKIKEDGKAALKSIKPRHPVSWLIHTDEYGNISQYEQRGPKGSLAVSPESLIHYKINQRFGNPYGKSDLRAAWEAWFIKKEIIKFYSIFLEKAASPTPVARYDTNLPAAAVDDIFTAIKKLQTKSALAIPKDIEMEFLETSNQGDVYIKGINLFNMFIGRSLLVPDLLGFQGSETGGGSYSLGKDQMSVFFRHIARRRQDAEDLINREIIKPLVYYNYGFIEECPKFKLKPINDDEAVELAKMWLEAVKGKVYKPNDEEINHFRMLTKFPDGEVLRDEPQQMLIEQEPRQEPDPEGDEPKNEPENPVEEEEKKEFKRVYEETVGDYSKKVNFKAIENTMKTLSESLMTEASPVIQDIVKDLSSQIKKKKIVESQKIEKIEDLKLKHLSKLKTILKKNFLKAHREAKIQAQSELLKGNKFAEPPVANEAFLKFLEQETGLYLGDYEYQLKKDAKLKLIQAIKDGQSLSSISGILDLDGMELSEASLERYARTKFTEVMNRGRHEFFESTGVIAAYQYSALLDDRTSDICSELHGKIFDSGDEPIPPLHFNCRSLLVPITKYEEYKADKSAGGMGIDKFIEENKGDGFAVK